MYIKMNFFGTFLRHVVYTSSPGIDASWALFSFDFVSLVIHSMQRFLGAKLEHFLRDEENDEFHHIPIALFFSIQMLRYGK